VSHGPSGTLPPSPAAWACRGMGPGARGAPGSRAGRAPARAPAGGLVGGEAGGGKAVRGRGAGELLGGRGGWAAGGQKHRGRVGRREKWPYSCSDTTCDLRIGKTNGIFAPPPRQHTPSPTRWRTRPTHGPAPRLFPRAQGSTAAPPERAGPRAGAAQHGYSGAGQAP